MAGKKKIPPEVRTEIAHRYAEGERTKKLVEEFGTTETTVRALAREHGVPVHPRGNRYREFSKQELAVMGAMWEDGCSQTAIAEHFRTGQSIVSRMLEAAGYQKEKRIRSGENHKSWKGGRHHTGQGYVLVKIPRDHPFAAMRGRHGYVLEHRLVMAQSLDRPLNSSETVHHKDGDKSNNDLRNLQLRRGNHGNGKVLTCADCGSHNIKERSIDDT